MGGYATRALAVALATIMTSLAAGSALAADAEVDERSRIVDAWTEALLSRDAARIQALPGEHPSVSEQDWIDLADIVLTRVMEQDAEARQLFLDPALAKDAREAAYADATALLASIMFERDALIARVQAEATANDPLSPPTIAPPPLPGPANGLLSAITQDVEALAAIPEEMLGTIGAIGDGAPGMVQLTPAPTPGRLLGLAPHVPVGADFAVCWRTSTSEGCQDVLPVAPVPIDVTGDGLADVLATLSVVAAPASAPVAPSLEVGDAEALFAPQVSLRVERLPQLDVLDDAPLEALIVGMLRIEDRTVFAGYDAYSADVPADARQAPSALTVLASAAATATGTDARLFLQTEGAGPALRALAGTSSATPWEPERLLALDTSPVPATLLLDLSAWEDEEGAHLASELELDGVTDLVASIHDLSDPGHLAVARLTADDIGPSLALTVHRGSDSQAWDWETATPLPRLSYSLDAWRGDAWKRETFEMTNVPARIRVDVPGHGSVELEASAVIGAVKHVRYSYDPATLRETYDEVSATQVPVSLAFSASDIEGSFQSAGSLASLSFQSASVDRAPAPGTVHGLLFDLASITTSFVGVRGVTAVEGQTVAIQLVSVPETLSFRLDDVGRGIDLDLDMSRGLGAIHGVVQIDDQRGLLYLSNLPKAIDIHAQFGRGAATLGYDASSGIQEAKALFTDLSLAQDPMAVHAFVQALQLPRALSLSLTRSGEAPKLDYVASASTTDIRAFVSETLFSGDTKARVLLHVDDLGARTNVGLVNEAGRKVLRLVSEPPTELIQLEGFVQQTYVGRLNEHVSDDCCLDAFGYDVRYGYDISATLVLKDLAVQLRKVSALDLGLGVPDLHVKGTFQDFAVGWDTLSMLGASSAWLDVDLTVLWVDIDVWSWGWSSATQQDVDILVMRYADQWGTLASIGISPCSFRIDTRPALVESQLNGFRLAALQGTTQRLFLNPLDGAGRTLVPAWLVTGYMAWQHGGWSLDLDCS